MCAAVVRRSSVPSLVATSRRPISTSSLRSSGLCPGNFGSYHRTDVFLNASADGVPTTGLAESYSQKAVHVNGAESASACYLREEESRIQSLVFAPSEIADKSEAPVVFQKLGIRLCRVYGRCECGSRKTPVVLAMFRLRFRERRG